MNRVLLLGLLIYSLLLLGLLTVNGGPIVLLVPLLLYVMAGIYFAPGRLQLEASREIEPERAYPGDPVRVKVTITNRGSAVEDLLLEDPLPPGLEWINGDYRLLCSLASGQSVELEYSVRGDRGLYRFENTRAVAQDFFSIFRREASIPSPAQFLVLPYTPLIKKVAIRPRETRVYSGTIPAREGGTGVDFFGVRAYAPGDSVRHINWRVSARYPERLFINEYEQERVGDVGIVLDARRRSNIETPAGSLFEHQVAAAAAISQALLRDGNRVSLLIYGQFLDRTYPGYGKIQRERILQALTRARPGDSLVFDRLENLPTRLLPIRSQIILISPLLNEDLPVLIQLRVRGYQLMVVSPDPIAFSESAYPQSQTISLAVRLARMERSLLFANLQHAGVRVLNWDVSIPFEQAMHQVLARTPPPIRSLRV
ncbi:MAG: DUF58 domain-containing protein [Chloroflexi bacterium]|jgi:uncharacterized protein (DUF58 family)|nr:DUF58 domain-containing protein [Chloroflexota bacterium]